MANVSRNVAKRLLTRHLRQHTAAVIDDVQRRHAAFARADDLHAASARVE